MMKEIYNVMNFCILWSLFFSNILFLIVDEETSSFKDVVTIETILIPCMYVLIYIIGKLVEKDIRDE